MSKYAVAFISTDNYSNSGINVGVTDSIEDAKKYLDDQLSKAIKNIGEDPDFDITKNYINDKHTYAELEWRSKSMDMVFTTDFVITETTEIPNSGK